MRPELTTGGQVLEVRVAPDRLKFASSCSAQSGSWFEVVQGNQNALKSAEAASKNQNAK